MEKQQKIELIKAALSGDRKQVEKILNTSKTYTFVSVARNIYCTNYEKVCDCCNPATCESAKTKEVLTTLYPKATFIDTACVCDPEYMANRSELFQRFGVTDETNQPASGVRNQVYKLISFFK